MIEDGAKSTVRESLVGVVVLQLYFRDSVHVARDGDLVLAARLIH